MTRWIKNWVKINNNNNNNSHKAYSPTEEPTHHSKISHDGTHSTTSSSAKLAEESLDDPESLAIRRLRNKSRRKLQKTRSASDLIREMAMADHSATHSRAESEDANRSRTFLNETKTRRTITDLQATESFTTTATTTTTDHSGNLPHHLKQEEPIGLNVNFLTHPFFSSRAIIDHEHRECVNCMDLEAKYMQALEDLEYLRKLVLLNEQRTKETNHSRTHAVPPIPNIADSSKQLYEVSSRHKKQVETLMKERLRWQRDVHCKLNKFATLCKNLNEESAVRNEESIALRDELESVRQERDETAEEVLRLRAKLLEYEQEKSDHEQMRQQLMEYETYGLNKAREAIQSRDVMIANLTSRLDQALNQLELERSQRPRRQIIFPPARPPSC